MQNHTKLLKLKGATILVAFILVCGNRVGASDVFQCACWAYLSILASWEEDRCNALPPWISRLNTTSAHQTAVFCDMVVSPSLMEWE